MSSVVKLQSTFPQISSQGGACIPVQCDHTQDADVEALFDRIRAENSGQLDILVNNAYSAVNVSTRVVPAPYWLSRGGSCITGPKL